MIEALALLLALQLLGEVLVRLLGLPLPGPVVGMALLFVGLLVRGEPVPDRLAATARGLLDNLSLLFVPAGVGVVVHIALVAEEWQALAASLLLSTLVTIVVTARVMQALGGRGRRE